MKRTNQTLLLSAAAVIIAANLPSCKKAKAETEMPKQPNIVYIMTDDHTAQMMSCYDSTHISTPNLDRIAKHGVRFTNSFVANSLSGPSRACMLTGKHSHANGFRSNETDVFDSSQPTFPKYLQEAGYETALFGKWHLHTLPTGFNTWSIVPGQGDYYNPDFIEMNGDTIQAKGYLTNIVTDRSLDWLENKRDKSKPFCLLIHHKAIHRNWLPDTEDLALYEDKEFEYPANFNDTYEGRPAAAAQEMSIGSDHDMDIVYDNKMLREGVHTRLTDTHVAMLNRMDSAQRAAYDAQYDPIIEKFYENPPTGEDLKKWKYQRYMRDYSKVVASLDRNVGRVLDYLEENDLLDNTIVVYTSDQGFYMGEHGWFDKRFMYEESMHTPLVMMLPKGLDKRGDIPQMVQNIDYAPTFLDLAGVPIPADMQGVSLLPLLKGENPEDWRDCLYYHYHEYPAEHAVKRHYGVRDGRYKLMHFYNDIDEWELYDLQEDPSEMNNLYGKPGTEEITRTMMKKLKKATEIYDDPIRHEFPINVD